MATSKSAPLAAPSDDVGFVWDGESTQWVTAQAATRHFDVQLDDGRELLQIPFRRIRAITKVSTAAKPKAKKVLQGILRYTTACDVFAPEKRGDAAHDPKPKPTATDTGADKAAEPPSRPAKRKANRAPQLTTPQKRKMRLRKNILGKTPKFPQWLSKRLEGFDDAEERSFWRKHCEVRGRVLEGMCYLLTVRECVCGGVCAGKCVRCQVGLCVPSPAHSYRYASRSLPRCSAECLARTDVNAHAPLPGVRRDGVHRRAQCLQSGAHPRLDRWCREYSPCSNSALALHK